MRITNYDYDYDYEQRKQGIYDNEYVYKEMMQKNMYPGCMQQTRQVTDQLDHSRTACLILI